MPLSVMLKALCLAKSQDLSFQRRITGERGRELPPKTDAWRHQNGFLSTRNLAVWLASSLVASFAVSVCYFNLRIPSVPVPSDRLVPKLS